MNIREKLQKWIQETLDVRGDFGLEYPDDVSHGDYSTNVAMVEAKKEAKSNINSIAQEKKNPKELSEQFVNKLNDKKIDEVLKIESAGPGFINIFLKQEVFALNVKDIIEKGEVFGRAKPNKKIWVIEHTSPNPNKAMHIGHLRNNLTGMALSRIAEANGYTVVCDAIDNDRGIAIAKLMWGYLKFAKKEGQNVDLDYWRAHQDEWQTPQEAGVRPDRFVDDLYVKGSEDFESAENVQKIVRGFVVLWEEKNKIIWELWKKVLNYSYEGQKKTLERLGNRWDFIWHEHEHYEMGKKYVLEGLKKGVFKKIEDGAIITNLEQYNISDTVVQKSDGTSLYLTQDLALTKLKLDKYKADKLFWVIGPEQSLAMKQMFAVCEQLGIGKMSDFTHISYGAMRIKGQGKMSSRKGNVLFIDDIIDEAKREIQKIMDEKKTTVADVEKISEMLALGAIKYGVLKVGRTVDISFDIAEAVNFQGDSGPYLQYATVRANSILKKTNGVEANMHMPSGWQTTRLERLLEKFPSVVCRAGEELAPQYIVTYLVELAGEFNSFYASTKIIDEEDQTSPYKLALTQSVVTVMTSGLGLLGIQVPEEM